MLNANIMGVCIDDALTLLVPVLTSAASIHAAELNLDQYAKRSKRERPSALVEARKGLAKLRQNRKIDVAERTAKVKELEGRIADLEIPLKPYFAVVDFQLSEAKIGSIGWYNDQTIDVAQVVDKSNALLHVSFFVGEGQTSSRRMWLWGMASRSMPVLTTYGVAVLNGLWRQACQSVK